MGREDTNYYIGLDIGTNSVGWAVTDEQYNVQKFNGKAMWGIHLFEEGSTAADRRMNRTARRRTDRARNRIALLNEIFSPEICKVDPDFLPRLKESRFFLEDKKTADKYTLFNDPDFTDVDYHKKYPTIYHLRRELIHSQDKHDIRLVYLAVLHIIKHRGHFLFEGRDFGDAIDFETVYNDLTACLADMEIEFCVPKDSIDEFQNVLKDREMTLNDKKKKYKNIVSVPTEKEMQPASKAVYEVLVGGSIKLANLFGSEELNDTEASSLDFKKDIDAQLDKFASVLDDDQIYLIEKMKAVYDWAVLTDLLAGHAYISEAQAEKYKQHQDDLKLLKAMLKTYAPDDYKKVFCANDGEKSYNAYVGHATGTKNFNTGKGYMVAKKCSQEDFCKDVAKKLRDRLEKAGIEETSLPQEEQDLLKRLDNITALPKPISKDNSVIPYQLHAKELEVILNNAARYYDFLNEVDESGYSNKEKIEKILTFRIPYYVGPLTAENNRENTNTKNAWMVKKEPGRILPWNWEQKVDKEASATNFIERMTNNCTYVIGETVVAKDSILYTKFMILNALNNIKVDGVLLDPETKMKLFEDNYLNYTDSKGRYKAKKMTRKAIKAYLERQGVAKPDGTSEITGIDLEIPQTMKAYVNFKNILEDHERIRETKMQEIADDIIYQITIFGETTALIENYVTRTYGDIFTENEIKQICRLRFSGWGTMSRKFLTGIYHIDPATGEAISIMSALETSQCNLMELLGNTKGYTFSVALKAENESRTSDRTGKLSYKVVDELYISPAVKRSTWRTIKIVDEITKIMKHPAAKIFVEMTRTEGEKKRTVSRKNQLSAIYNASKKDCEELSKQLDGFDENQLRSKKLYLYFLQMGRSLYSGDPIDLDDLFSTNSHYDIDHIYPQSKTKDDSLDNTCLVEKTLNAKKTDVYPLPDSYKTPKTIALWKNLLDKGLMSREKYSRLISNQPLTDDMLAGFINRQLVETSQSMKAVTQLLSNGYPESKIVYVKGSNVSSFRYDRDTQKPAELADPTDFYSYAPKFQKSRSVNDYHHAKDAYLQIVVGNVYDVKFGANVIKFVKAGIPYHFSKIYNYEVKDSHTVAWVPGETIETVKYWMGKNNIQFTRYAGEQKGAFYDITLMKHGKGQFPVKTSDERFADIDKYGGYNKVAGAYFALVEYTKNGKKGDSIVKSFEPVPIYLTKSLNSHPELLQKHFEDQLGKVRIIIPKIKINALLEYDGFRMHLSGRTSNQLLFKGAEQLVLPAEQYDYFKKIDSFVTKNVESKGKAEISPFSGINADDNLKIYDSFTDKLSNSKYKVRFSSQINLFEKGRSKFQELSLKDQVLFLSQAVNIFHCNPNSADLSLIGGAKSAGILVQNKELSNKNKVFIIDQSITGLYENRSKDLSTL